MCPPSPPPGPIAAPACTNKRREGPHCSKPRPLRREKKKKKKKAGQTGSPTVSSQAPAVARQSFLPEDGEGVMGRAVSDALDPLSCFSSEAEANDIMQTLIRVMPPGIKTAKSESMALADLRGQLRQTEMVIKQSVEEADAFKIELDQLREVAARSLASTAGSRTRHEPSKNAERWSWKSSTPLRQRLAIAVLQDLSRSTDARLNTLNSG